jgi:hypothetical protein
LTTRQGAPGDSPGASSWRPLRNATTLREVNEAIEEGRITADGPVAFVCECGRVGCDALVELTVEEYEAVRGDARRFFVEPGHELPDDVVDARYARFVVTTKQGPAADAALREDPRADRPVVQLGGRAPPRSRR